MLRGGERIGTGRGRHVLRVLAAIVFVLLFVGILLVDAPGPTPTGPGSATTVAETPTPTR